jgi:hypothetical protein
MTVLRNSSTTTGNRLRMILLPPKRRLPLIVALQTSPTATLRSRRTAQSDCLQQSARTFTVSCAPALQAQQDDSRTHACSFCPREDTYTHTHTRTHTHTHTHSARVRACKRNTSETARYAHRSHVRHARTHTHTHTRARALGTHAHRALL